MIKIQEIVDDTKCYEQVRALRWPEQVTCPHCASRKSKKRGFHSKQAARQRYRCRKCQKDFDDLSQTALAGHHQPLKVWLLCLYFMGLNLSNRQIAQELELNQDDVQQMTAELRQLVYARRHPVQLRGEVECDEVYLVAGHKGHPAIVRALGRDGRRGAHLGLDNHERIFGGASMKSIPTRSKAFDRSYGLGCGPIAASHKKNCPFIWLSLSSFIMSVNAARRFSLRFCNACSYQRQRRSLDADRSLKRIKSQIL